MALTPALEQARRVLSIVVGFDPGLAAAGLAIVDALSLRALRAWTVRTSPATPLAGRLRELERELKIALDGAGLLAIEDQHQTFFAKLAGGTSNPAAGRLERVVGLAYGLARARDIDVIMVTPQHVRTRIGLRANAKKNEIGRAIRIQLAGLAPGLSSHALDAAAIALAGARQWHGESVTRREIA